MASFKVIAPPWRFPVFSLSLSMPIHYCLFTFFIVWLFQITDIWDQTDRFTLHWLHLLRNMDLFFHVFLWLDCSFLFSRHQITPPNIFRIVCELSCGCLELNSSPLEQQSVLLTLKCHLWMAALPFPTHTTNVTPLPHNTVLQLSLILQNNEATHSLFSLDSHYWFYHLISRLVYAQNCSNWKASLASLERLRTRKVELSFYSFPFWCICLLWRSETLVCIISLL